jgi:hypothetical protein
MDYFRAAERDALYAKLGSYDGSVHRTVEPRCGQVFQDSLDGGIAGGWFPESLSLPFLLAGEDVLVGFLYGNVDPSAMYFSIGQSVAPLGRTLTFPYSGSDPPGDTHNISFTGARYRPDLPNQPRYCWDGLTTAEMASGTSMTPELVPGHILAQFTSPTRVRFEYLPTGNCTAARLFTTAAEFFIR